MTRIISSALGAALLALGAGCGIRSANSVNVYLPHCTAPRIYVLGPELRGDHVAQGKTVTTDATASTLP
jgi:hypothetical protein